MSDITRAEHIRAIIFTLAFGGLVFFGGYLVGKHAADRWYAKHQPVAATPQIVTCSGVTLIDPIKVRTTAPVANIEEHDIRPQPHAPVILYNLEHDGLCKWGYVDDSREGHMYDAPCRVASVEEPR